MFDYDNFFTDSLVALVSSDPNERLEFFLELAPDEEEKTKYLIQWLNQQVLNMKDVARYMEKLMTEKKRTALNFGEEEMLNAVWSGMAALQKKENKDAADVAALARSAQAITSFLKVKTKWAELTHHQPALAKVGVALLD